MIGFQISREELLKPCVRVLGAVERKQTLPILGNVLLVVKNQLLSISGTDLEIEVVARVPLIEPAQEGAITVPARKLVDICKALPEKASIVFKAQDEFKAKLQAGKSRFTLACLPSKDFPVMDEGPGKLEFSLNQNDLRILLDSVSYSMAQQDSRYYLNGMLFDILGGQFRVVAADGHRLAMATIAHGCDFLKPTSIIIPRKAVMEMQRLFAEGQEEVGVVIGDNHLSTMIPQFSFTTKLIDGAFPDFRKVLPKGEGQVAIVERETLKQALVRIAVLLNNKRQGVGLVFSENKLQIVANNSERDEGEDELEISYSASAVEIGFNVHYLLEYLTHMKCQTIKISLGKPEDSVLFEPNTQEGGRLSELYVVMPMRL